MRFSLCSAMVAVGLGLALSGCGEHPGMDTVESRDPCSSMGGYEQDAPWPTACRCPSRACYSPAVGPATPEVAWHRDDLSGGTFPFPTAAGNILISADGTLYVLRDWNELVALSRTGDELWSYAQLPDLSLIGEWSGLSAIGRDGTLYVHTYENIVALTPDGQLKWEAEPAVGYFGPISLGQDGTIYTIDSEETVTALSEEGEPLWTLPCPPGNDCRTPAHGPGGGIVQLGFVGWDGGYARQVLWQLDDLGSRFEISSFEANYAFIGGVDAYDNLYIIGDIQQAGGGYSRVYALGANGIERWHHDYDWQQVQHPTTGPAVGADGRLFLARSVYTIPEDRTAHLEALNPDGTVRWDKPVANEISGRPIVDADGNLYFGAEIDGQCSVLSLSPEGTERWRLNCSGDRPAMVGSMDIDGTLYVVDQSGLFAIRHATP